MPYYDTLSEAEYNALSEATYNLLQESPVIMFKGGQVLFSRYGKVSFCPSHCDCGHHLGDPSPCTWPTAVSQPPCVVIRKFDFSTCPECVTTVAGGTLPMMLWYDGAVLFATNDSTDTYSNTTSIRLYANIQLDTGTCKWVLTIRCQEGAPFYDVWVGEKAYGKTPVGTYVRTGGCDTTEQITVN